MEEGCLDRGHKGVHKPIHQQQVALACLEEALPILLEEQVCSVAGHQILQQEVEVYLEEVINLKAHRNPVVGYLDKIRPQEQQLEDLFLEEELHLSFKLPHQQHPLELEDYLVVVIHPNL